MTPSAEVPTATEELQTERNTSGNALTGSTSWQTMAYGNGTFVAVSKTGEVSTSPDGAVWTSRTPLTGAATWQTMTFGNGLFVVAARGSDKAATSPDGIVWTPRTLPGSGTWTALSYGGGTFVALADDGVAAVSH